MTSAAICNATASNTSPPQCFDRKDLEQILRDCRWDNFDLSSLEGDCCSDCIAQRRYELTKVGITETEDLLLEANDANFIRTAYRVLARPLQREVEIAQRVEDTLALLEGQRIRADHRRSSCPSKPAKEDATLQR
jgi:hypothetical protein